jgi:hypothetical protein
MTEAGENGTGADIVSDTRTLFLVLAASLLAGSALAAWRWRVAGPGHRLRFPYLFDAVVLAIAGAAFAAGALFLDH